MSSPSVLNFPKLLAAIPPSPNGALGADSAAPANPAGVDLRADRAPTGLYEKIRAAMSVARTAEYSAASLMGQTKPEEVAKCREEWGKSRTEMAKVLENGATALEEKTKDLEVAAYLIEALVRLHGFAGLRDGLRLAREFVEKYWEHLYPVPSADEGEDKVELRVRTLAQVLRAEGKSALTIPLARVPLTQDNTPLGALSQYHYRRAQEVSALSDPKLKQKQIDAGAPTLDMFRESVAQTPPEFFVNLFNDLTACLDELTRLSQLLDKLCLEHKIRCDEAKVEKDTENYAPSTSNVRVQLTACLDALKDVAQSKLPTAPVADGKTEKKAPDQAKTATATGAAAESVDVIRDRDDAFRVLGKVADFFKTTEPHSVVSYALEQVVRWGKMPLPELLSELIPDDGPRKSLFQRVGIKAAEPAKGESKGSKGG